MSPQIIIKGAVMATQHLLENGHAAIACIQGLEDSVPNKLRIEGFRNAMKEAGIEHSSISGNDFSEQKSVKNIRI